MPKPKTLYTDNKNVDITSLLSSNPKITSNSKNLQAGGSKSRNKKNYSDDESEYGSESDDDNSEEEEEDEELDEENEEVNEEVNEEDDEEDNEEINDEEVEESEEEDAKSVKSNESDDEFKDEEKKCYSKYALPDSDDIDYDELFADDDFKMKKNERLTKPFLSKYEMVRLLSVRAKQLAQGAKPMIKNTVGLSPKEIALLELKNKVVPLIIERPVPNSGVERWKLSELEIPENIYN